jgi:hypothetical protein
MAAFASAIAIVTGRPPACATRGRQPMHRHSVGGGAVTERGPSGGVTQNIFMRK